MRHTPNPQQLAAARSQLRSCALLSPLDQPHFEDLLQRLKYAELVDGEILFRQETPATEFFLVQSGCIKLSRISQHGHEKIIDLVTPPHTFAEAVLFSKAKTYPVTASALAESHLWCIDAKSYASLLSSSPDACFAVLAELSQRLHVLVADIDRLTLHNAASQL